MKKQQADSGSLFCSLPLRRRLYDVGIRCLLIASAVIICALLVFLIGYIFHRGLPNLSWSFLTSQESVLRGTEGVLPAIKNTVYVIVVTLLFILPIGVGAAIYLTEYAAGRRLVSIIEFANEILAGIPSILYALVGVLFFCEFLGLGKTLLAGSLTIVMMTLPTIIRTTQESLRTVPQGYREGALALGAGKWHVIRTIVLPCTINGIVTGCILAIGRIVGESAVLMFTAGLGTNMQDFFDLTSASNTWKGLTKSSGATLTIALYVYAKERANYDLAFTVASVLLILTFAINLAARIVGKTLTKSKTGER